MHWTVVPKTEDSLRFITEVSFVPHFKTEKMIDWHNYTAIALELKRIGEPFLSLCSFFPTDCESINALCLVLKHELASYYI